MTMLNPITSWNTLTPQKDQLMLNYPVIRESFKKQQFSNVIPKTFEINTYYDLVFQIFQNVEFKIGLFIQDEEVKDGLFYHTKNHNGTVLSRLRFHKTIENQKYYIKFTFTKNGSTQYIKSPSFEIKSKSKRSREEEETFNLKLQKALKLVKSMTPEEKKRLGSRLSDYKDLRSRNM